MSRIRSAAQMARAGGFDYFTTTLSISPLKNAQKLNEIGEAMGEKYGVRFEFCKKADTGRRILELLGGAYENQ